MDLIPAIDLMNGKCVRLFKGDFNKRKDFTKEPYEQAKFCLLYTSDAADE